MFLHTLCNIVAVLNVFGTAHPLKVSLILWTPSSKLPQLTGHWDTTHNKFTFFYWQKGLTYRSLRSYLKKIITKIILQHLMTIWLKLGKSKRKTLHCSEQNILNSRILDWKTNFCNIVQKNRFCKMLRIFNTFSFELTTGRQTLYNLTTPPPFQALRSHGVPRTTPW